MHQAALSVIAGTDTSIPKSADGAVESMRILISERRSAAKTKTQTLNQIHALLITAIDSQLESLVRAVNPSLLCINGVGPLTAATLLVAAGDNPERLATKASFAALAGAAPIPASSGQRTRHRLSRGGNRHANAALHRIVLLRIRHREPRTMAYFERRRAEGLTDRDIMRCLKRHIANEIYAALLNPSAGNTAGPRLRAQRQQAGIPISVLAAMLGVPYQRLRRLEIGTRTDPELEMRASAILDQINAAPAA